MPKRKNKITYNPNIYGHKKTQVRQMRKARDVLPLPRGKCADEHLLPLLQGSEGQKNYFKKQYKMNQKAKKIIGNALRSLLIQGSECTWEHPPTVVDVEVAIAQALHSYGVAMIEELPQPGDNPAFTPTETMNEYQEGCVDGYIHGVGDVLEKLIKFNSNL